MSTIITFKKDGKQNKVQVKESADAIFQMLEIEIQGDFRTRYSRPDFVRLTQMDGRVIIFNRHFINIIYE